MTVCVVPKAFYALLSCFPRLARQALGEVYQGSMPSLRHTVDLGCKAVDAGAGGRGTDAFKRLAGDFGKMIGRCAALKTAAVTTA